MKFTPEKAREIIRAFNLSESNFAVWKNRNAIPDKYNKYLVPMREEFNKLDMEVKNRLIDRCINKNDLTRYLDTTMVEWDIDPKKLENAIRTYVNYQNRKEITSIGDNKLVIYEQVKKYTGKTDKFFLDVFNTQNLNKAISGLIELMRTKILREDFFEECKACGFLNPDETHTSKYCQKCGNDLWPGLE